MGASIVFRWSWSSRTIFSLLLRAVTVRSIVDRDRLTRRVVLSKEFALVTVIKVCSRDSPRWRGLVPVTGAEWQARGQVDGQLRCTAHVCPD